MQRTMKIMYRRFAPVTNWLTLSLLFSTALFAATSTAADVPKAATPKTAA